MTITSSGGFCPATSLHVEGKVDVALFLREEPATVVDTQPGRAGGWLIVTSVERKVRLPAGAVLVDAGGDAKGSAEDGLPFVSGVNAKIS